MIQGAAFGIRRLQDAHSRFFRGTLKLYYRTRNFVPANSIAAEMGIAITPATGTGTSDILICPPPSGRMMKLEEIEAAVADGIALRAGARLFNISHTWVCDIQKAAGFENPRQVFWDQSVVGFYSDNLLFTIGAYNSNVAYGNIINWDVMVNSNEIK